MDKSTFRHELKEKLMGLSKKDRIDKSKKICGFLIQSDMFRQATVIMTYLPLPHEVDTTALILTAWQQGKTVAVPKVSWQQRHMIPVEIKSLDTGFQTDDHGLRNPVGASPVPFDEIDLVITPGLGYDREGNRLGRGGSYYDNFFTQNKITAKRCGVAFSEQLCDEIPHDEKDVPVHAIVTEYGIVMCDN